MAALAKAQGEIGDIARNRTVTVTPRNGGQSYQFRYATLDAIIDAIKKPLADNGITRMQIISHNSEGGYYVLTTALYCGEQFISSVVPIIAEGSSNQQFGSALTYMKRYALAAILGIAADEDDDGNSADGNEIKAVADKAPKAPAPDPISSGLPKKVLKTVTEEFPMEPATAAPVFYADHIPVPMLKDDSGSDWMAWGQNFMAKARIAPSLKSLQDLETSNAVPLKSMETAAPKMFTNLSIALIKVRKELEKKNG